MAPKAQHVGAGLSLALLLAAGVTLWATSASWGGAVAATAASAAPPNVHEDLARLHAVPTDKLGDEPEPEATAPPPALLEIQLFGLFHTGTIRLQSLLKAMYPSASVCPDDEGKQEGAPTCLTPQSPSKHSNPEMVREFLSDPAFGRRHVVLTTRDPFSNLLAMRKEPYQLAACIPAGAADWLTRECTCLAIDDRPDPLCESGQEAFSSLPALWNTYAGGAAAIWKQRWPGRAGRLYLLRYEDFMVHPEEALAAIRDSLGLPEPEVSVNVTAMLEKNAKVNDIPHVQRVQAILSRSYLNSFSKADVRTVCGALDPTTLQRLAYTSECQGLRGAGP